MPTLSVVMIVKNESKHLADCLRSVGDLANEIIVLDSGSTDETVAIAQAAGAQVYSHTDWQGFGKQRQIAQQYATGDYVLWLDADERITPELRQSILGVLAAPLQNKAYQINRFNHVFGFPLKHIWSPDYVLRLYPRLQGRYSDAMVHESVQLAEGVAVATLAGDLLHDTYADLGQYLQKSIYYSELWAEQNRHKRVHFFSGSLHGFWCFVRLYLIKRGFLDGKVGLLLAILSAGSIFNKYMSLWLWQKNEQGQKITRDSQ